jgi:L-ascorbate metabolism protein UlaG (beta-lactamase superfamily)
MKLTKFAHSCVMVETKGEKIIIDPGVYSTNEEMIKRCKNSDAILITHKHSDHCDIEAINKIKGEKTKVYTSKEVLEFYPELKAEIVHDGYNISIGEVLIEVVKAVHGYLPILKGDKEVHEGLGFIIDRGKKVYFVGDSISFKNEYKCDVLFVPVNNHGVCMGPYDAAAFAKETNAELVIPYHCESPKLPADIPKVKEEFEKAGLNYKFLKIGETIEL